MISKSFERLKYFLESEAQETPFIIELMYWEYVIILAPLYTSMKKDAGKVKIQ